MLTCIEPRWWTSHVPLWCNEQEHRDPSLRDEGQASSEERVSVQLTSRSLGLESCRDTGFVYCSRGGGSFCLLCGQLDCEIVFFFVYIGKTIHNFIFFTVSVRGRKPGSHSDQPSMYLISFSPFENSPCVFS